MIGSMNKVAVGLGAAAGLFCMVFAGLVGVGLLWIGDRWGTDPGETGRTIVIAAALLGGQLVAGYTAGRLVPAVASRFHGFLAALAVYAAVALFSLIAGSPVSPLTLAFFAVLAAVTGHLAGAFATKGSR